MSLSAPDVVVIGAGPAGAAAAARLHAAGISCRVVEQTRFPRFVIGESLLPRCNDLLAECGFLDDVAARGFVEKRGATFARDAQRRVFDFARVRHGGWTRTWQVERADFDHTLTQNLERRGVPIDFETSVEAVEPGSPRHRVRVRDADGTRRELTPRFIVDASGYGRVLPRLFGLEAPSAEAPRASLFAHFQGDRRPEGPSGGNTWVCEAPGGAWLWMIPLRDGRVSAGCVAPVEFFATLTQDTPEARLRAVIASEPAASARVGGLPLAMPPREVRGFSVSVTRSHGPGWVLIGNSPEFVDPILSSGVMLALESGVRAADLVARELAGEQVDWQANLVEPMRAGTETFRTFVHAWYEGLLQEIFYAEDPSPDWLRNVTSVLAGYVWDSDNPLVIAPRAALLNLRRKIRQRERLLRDL